MGHPTTINKRKSASLAPGRRHRVQKAAMKKMGGGGHTPLIRVRASNPAKVRALERRARFVKDAGAKKLAAAGVSGKELQSMVVEEEPLVAKPKARRGSATNGAAPAKPAAPRLPRSAAVEARSMLNEEAFAPRADTADMVVPPRRATRNKGGMDLE